MTKRAKAMVLRDIEKTKVRRKSELNLRLSVIKAMVSGATIEQTLSTIENISLEQVALILVRYQNGGLGALLNAKICVPKINREYLAFARKLIAFGRDPENPDRALTNSAIVRAIERKFGVTFAKDALRLALAKLNLSVRQAKFLPITKAQSEGNRIACYLDEAQF